MYALSHHQMRKGGPTGEGSIPASCPISHTNTYRIDTLLSVRDWHPRWS